ncbi:formate--tetrahydrofolate ligase [Mesosutterella sp. AGMB02718]|uniref:Formate--tetrahydrofolate ligase n=1 Tax=Mesosutterella faecium TaxID=2925194 RepID=A0ABT7ILS3_9BURK|nr:formate--tetrahydrofolate ligase [Mesosutterella sp. AGMB02718]MDL2059315.1 formate--tetrahydrofolate ligase [Mesosutterella sp. AGMB02718]
MLSDIEIAHAAKLKPIEQLAHEIGLTDEEFEPYGRDKAKVKLSPERKPHGKLILVTATSGMPAGSGKTTTSIALAQGLRRIGKKSCLALREPSLGPCFGMKGGAAGGGYSQVLPMESINLHFTGDFHAITAANNLLAAIIDNCRFRGEHDIKEVTWKRVLDVNDRQLRFIVTGLGGSANGVPAETGFDITVASELMAVFCLAKDEEDLRARIDRMVVATKRDGSALTVKEIGCTGALMALLLEAVKPNLVQTIEGGPAFIHGGPFANIAHGCNSVAATKAALTIGDYAITEAGFGSELGGEKFFDIKCRSAGLRPNATVIVTSTRALHWHGGVPLADIAQPNIEALKKGLCNLDHHVRNMQGFGPNVVVALNHFANDDEAEIEVIRRRCEELGARFAVSDGFARGGAGAEELARQVVEACEGDPRPIKFAYEEDAPILDKLQAVITRCYGAKDFSLSPKAVKDLKQIESLGFGRLPICIAKTPLSLSHDPKLLGAPKGFTIPVERLILNAGAGFVVITTGSILRMPGLPKVPNAFKIDVKDGQIVGLS